MALPTLGVLDKDSAPQTISTLRSGSAVRADSAGVALSTEDIALIDGLETAIASTNTKLDTVITHVDTLETLIASTNTKLDTAITALQIIDNQQVTILAGTANIGDVDVLTLPALVAGTANIGDVDVLSIIPGTAATNQGKAVDAAAGATDTGVAILAIRDDALTTLTPADGDYANLRVNSTGALHVTGGGGGTEYTEDVAAAPDPSGQMLMGVRRDTLTVAEVTADGDNIAIKATSKGQLHTYDADVLAAINAGVASSLPAGTNNIGDVDVLSFPSGEITTTFTPSCFAGALAVGDVCFATEELTNVVLANAGQVELASMQVSDISDLGAAVDLYFFNANTTLGAEDAPPDIDDTEVLTVVGGPVRILAADWVDLGVNRVARIDNMGVKMKAGAATTSLWVAGVTQTAATFAAGTLQFKFTWIRR